MREMLLLTCMVVVSTMAWAKTERTYYDAETMTRVKEKIAKHSWPQSQVSSAAASAEWYLRMSDQEIWDFVPPPEQLRAINVCIAHDCPFCGDEITRKAGHYPWKMSRDNPFKVTCPVCERTLPENDFEPWNTEGLEGKPETGERIIDKGLGWVGTDGRRYYFVPYYIFWQRWCRDVLGGMATLGRAYLLTGEPVYARKCAIMMAKLASEYERFNYRVQAYHEGRFDVPGRISDRIWSTGDDTKIAIAYDSIYPALDQDQELLAFLKEKGIDDPRQLIEQKMLNVMANDVMSGAVAGNMGMHQHTLCTLAIVLDNDDPAKGPTTAQMRDWLMSGAGRVEDLLWNGFWRDGLGAESSPGYSWSWCSNFYLIAELLPKLGVDIWSNPKLKKMADIGIDMTVADRFGPNIGDSGGLKGSGPIGRSVSVLGPAFTHYADPRHAKVLALMNATCRDLFEDYFDEEDVAKVVAEQGTDLGLKTRNIGGYGLAVLESGKDDSKRAVTMYYGYAAGGHGHHDRLNIQMWAFGRPMMPEDGYPFPFTRPDFWAWRSTDTVKHYCVVVDETSHRTQYAGDLNTLASTPEVQYMDASAEIAYPNMVSLYRRSSALIDISEESSYLLDIFRVRGGVQHDWCFHGPAFFDLLVEGGQFGPTQEKGTLAGENVPYGTKPPPSAIGNGTSGYHGLYNVRRMRPAGRWSATWHKADEDLSLTMTMPAGCAQEVIVADASPELQPGNPDVIQYVLGRNIQSDQAAQAREELLSKYVAVVEPHHGPAAITGVEYLKTDGISPESVGLLVHREGATDLIHSSLAPAEKCDWQGADSPLSVAAEFALLTLDERGIRRAVVVNGTLLQYGDFALRPAPSPEGKVLALDFTHNAITIDTALTMPEACRDNVVILGNERHKTSYTIKGAQVAGGKTTLGFGDVLYVIGMGAVTGTDQDAMTVISDRPLAGYGRVDGGLDEGRWLYNEDKSKGFRITSIDGSKVVLEAVDSDLVTVFADADGDGRRLYWISDIGPGDTFRIPVTTYYARQDRGR